MEDRLRVNPLPPPMDFARWRLVREIGIDRIGGSEPSSRFFYKPSVLASCQGTPRFVVIDDRRPDPCIAYVIEKGQLRRIELTGFLAQKRNITSLSAASSREFAAIVDGGVCCLARLMDNELRAHSELTPSSLRDLNLYCVDWSSDALLLGDGGGRGQKQGLPAGVTLLSLEGKVLWDWRPGADVLGHATHVSIVEPHGIVVTDAILHQVVLVSWDKSIRWTVGQPGQPGNGITRLAEPLCTTATPQGTLLITDNRNDRLLEIGMHGRLLRTLASSRDADGANIGPFDSPRMAFQDEQGVIAITDSGNGRVIALKWSGETVWCLGPSQVPRRLFSYPRSFERLSRDVWLVTDTNNNRCVEIDADNQILWQYGEGIPTDNCQLYWPRSAKRLANGTTVIADGLNRRIVWVGLNGQLQNELTHIRTPSGRSIRLLDPHDVTITPDGNILLTDALRNLVAKIDYCGTAVWLYGDECDGDLDDPHQAIVMGHDTHLVVDSRGITVLDQSGNLVSPAQSRFLGSDGGSVNLMGPKAIALGSGLIVVADPLSEEHELVFLTPTMDLAWAINELGSYSQSSRSRLNALVGVRCLAMRDNSLTISDVCGHRIVEARPISGD